MRKRYGRGRISNFLMAFLILLACGMGIGYAALSTTLTIDGTSDIDRAVWDVHFENVQVTTGSVNATTPAISNDTEVGFSVSLEDPGDFYEFTVDVVNSGTMDAMIDGFTISPELTSDQEKYLEYKVTYLDGGELEEKQKLAVGSSEIIKVRFNRHHIVIEIVATYVKVGTHKGNCSSVFGEIVVFQFNFTLILIYCT